MRVTILDLDLSRPQPVLGGKAVGFPCRFTSELGGGAAFLALPPGEPLDGAGRECDVRLLPEEITGLRPLAAQAAPTPALSPSEAPGDFEAVGMATSILWLDDEQEHGLLEVQLGEERLSIPLEGEGDDLDYGQWVAFRLRRLVLAEG